MSRDAKAKCNNLKKKRKINVNDDTSARNQMVFNALYVPVVNLWQNY